MNTLSLRDAAEEFGVPSRTLTGWAAAGLLTIVRRPEKRGQPMLVDRDSVARAAEIHQPGRGHWNRSKIRDRASA